MAVEEAGLPVAGASSVRSPGCVRRYAGLALVALCAAWTLCLVVMCFGLYMIPSTLGLA